MEVTTALGVISFGLVALLGVFPLGLDNSRICVSETRASQLSKAIFSTLQTEASTATAAEPNLRCFGNTALSLPLDGQTYSEEEKLSDVAVQLYVSYDVLDQPRIVRDAVMPQNSIYQISATFRPKTFSYEEFSSTGTTLKRKRVVGYDVRLVMSGMNKTKPFFQISQFVPSFRRVASWK